MNRRTPPWRPLAFAAGLALLTLAAGACSSPEGPSPQPGPTLTCPADVSVVSNDGSAVPVTYSTPAAVGGTTPVTVACVPPSGSSFKPGSSSVTCTATDAQARTATCGFAVRVSVPPRLTLTKFMAFGDSLTEGKQSSIGPLFKLTDFAGSYPTVMASLLLARYPSQSPTMSKQGLGGETTSAGVSRLQGLLASEHPQVVLLMEGANDLSGGDATMIAPAARNMDQMVLSAKGAGATVFLATLPPQVPGGYRAGGAGLVTTYNTQMKSVAATRAVPLVDTYTALSESVTTYVGPDGLHLTTAGYQKLGEVFFAAARVVLEIPGTTPGSGAYVPLGTRIDDDSAAQTGLKPRTTTVDDGAPPATAPRSPRRPRR
jgi:lysophospholipase L1-like esterase